MLPKAVSLVRYVPVPRIEYQDADIDLVIENLVFESDNFLPSRIYIDSHSHAEFTSAYTFESEYGNRTTIYINEFRVRARDISYAFRKKTGFFQWEDKGLIDIYVPSHTLPACPSSLLLTDLEVGQERCFGRNQIDRQRKHLAIRRFLLPSRQSFRQHPPLHLLPPTIRTQHPRRPILPLCQIHYQTPTTRSSGTRN